MAGLRDYRRIGNYNEAISAAQVQDVLYVSWLDPPAFPASADYDIDVTWCLKREKNI